MLAVAFLYLCFTMTMFLGSFILTQNHYPFFIGGARFFGSGLILLSIYKITHQKNLLRQLPQLFSPIFFKYALCLYTISALGFSWGMQYVDPVKACFVFVLAPFITALLLYFFYDEQLTHKKIAGLIIGFCSIIPILLASDHGIVSNVPWYLSMAGYFIFGCSVITFAYGWILNKELHQVVHVSSLLLTGAALVFGGGVTLGCSLLFHGFDLFSMQVTDDFWWLLLLFAILTAVSYNLYSYLLKKYSATFLSFASFLEPAFGLLYAKLFLAQDISFIAYCCLVGLSFGLYLFYQEELRLE
ncbi:MAG: DMT family transporter [Candidatus Chromulinivorax sp.]